MIYVLQGVSYCVRSFVAEVSESALNFLSAAPPPPPASHSLPLLSTEYRPAAQYFVLKTREPLEAVR